MSLHDAAWAIREAMKVCEEAEDMIRAGAVGEILADSLQHAKELLDIADEEMADVDTARYQVLALASPTLRAKLTELREKNVF